jgi:hypothetical protein
VTDDHYDEDTCKQKLEDAGFKPCMEVPILEHHCENITQKTHDWCEKAQKGMYYPFKTMVCVKIVDGQWVDYTYADEDSLYKICRDKGDPWEVRSCECCCMCLAYGTPIATPTGTSRIEELRRGDKILASAPPGSSALEWAPVAVDFSDGTAGEATSHSMVYLGFGPEQGPGGELVCTSDQVVLVNGGGLVRASQLHAGDHLVDQAGNPVEIRTISIGEFHGGIHHISTAAPKSATAEHLILAGGIVVGDYFLQTVFDGLPAEHKVPDLDDRPHLWSEEYAAQDEAGDRHAYQILFGDTPDAATGTVIRTLDATFVPYTGRTAQPDGPFAALLTPAQAADVLKNGKFTTLSNSIPHAVVSNIFKRMQGFYPDVQFYLDWYQPTPNVYAVKQYDREFVVITGGLARLIGLGYPGLAAAIAHGVQRLLGGDPVDRYGFTATAVADYLSFLITARDIWLSPAEFDQSVSLAFGGMSKLLELISPENAGGNPHDPINEPSVDCRIRSLSSGAAGGNLPECAGGPPRTKVALEGAKAVSATSVELATNLLVTADSAADAGHYTITPSGTVTAASRKEQERPHIIELTTAELIPDRTYKITIHGLQAEREGTGVDPEHDTREFTVPK